MARLSSQSPQMVMSGLHGVKPSDVCVFAAFFIFAVRTFSILVIFDIRLTNRPPHKPEVYWFSWLLATTGP